jgi:hypothetical protein
MALLRRCYLDNDQQANASAQGRWIAVHAAHDVHDSLTQGDEQTENCKRKKRKRGTRSTNPIMKDMIAHKRRTLGSAIEKSTVLRERLVDGDDLGTSQQLHDHTRGNDGGDTELHQGA